MKITKEKIQEKVQEKMKGLDKEKAKKNAKRAAIAVGTGVVAVIATKTVIKTRSKCKEVETDEFELLIECEERQSIKDVEEMSDREYIEHLNNIDIIPDEVMDYINELEKEKEELEYIVGNKEVC